MKTAVRMFAAFACVLPVADLRAVPVVLAQTLPQVSRFFVILLCAGSLGFAAGSKLERVKDKYHVIQVETFAIQKGVDFPVELLSPLQDEVAKQLRGSKEFPEVLAAGGVPTILMRRFSGSPELSPTLSPAAVLSATSLAMAQAQRKSLPSSRSLIVPLAKPL